MANETRWPLGALASGGRDSKRCASALANYQSAHNKDAARQQGIPTRQVPTRSDARARLLEQVDVLETGTDRQGLSSVTPCGPLRLPADVLT